MATAATAIVAILSSFPHGFLINHRFSAVATNSPSSLSLISALASGSLTSRASQPVIPCLSLTPYGSSLAAFSGEMNAYTSEEDLETDDELLDWADSSSTSRSKPATSSAGRLYVGNLPYSMTPSQLTDVFSQAGSVQGVEVVYDRVTDRSRGFAFVTMASVEDANEAIRMFNGAQVGGRTVKVNFPEVPRGGEREMMGPRIRSSNRGFVDSPFKVYAGNLGWAVTSEKLRLVFGEQQGVLGARVIYDRDSGRSRGYGFVSFESPVYAQSAIDNLNGMELEGRPLRLSLAAERTVRSMPTAASNFTV